MLWNQREKYWNSRWTNGCFQKGVPHQHVNFLHHQQCVTLSFESFVVWYQRLKKKFSVLRSMLHLMCSLINFQQKNICQMYSVLDCVCLDTSRHNVKYLTCSYIRWLCLVFCTRIKKYTLKDIWYFRESITW